MKRETKSLFHYTFAAIMAVCVARSPQVFADDGPELATKVYILSESSDQDQLAHVAVEMINTKNPEALDRIVGFLTDNDFLNRLDSEKQYDVSPNLRISALLRAIAGLGSSQADDAFVRLSRDRTFAAKPRRVDSLIDAIGLVSSPSPALLDFLDKLGRPHTGYLSRVKFALLRSGSPEAGSLVEKRLWSREYKPGWKAGLFCGGLLAMRDSPQAIIIYKHAVQRGFSDPGLRNLMVQSLFDWREKWYAVDGAVLPPNRRQACDAMLRELLVIAEMTKKLDLTDETRESVRKGTEEINDILKRRAKVSPDRLERLVSDLENRNFSTREQATRELTEVADVYEPLLRKARENCTSPEGQKRMDAILKSIKPPVYAND